MKNGNKRVVACMATFPARHSQSLIVLKTILPQVDHLYVYLNNYQEVPSEYSHPKVSAVLADSDGVGDLRDMGKFYFLGDLQNEIVFLIDDDICYPPNYVSRMTDRVSNWQGLSVIGVHGRTLDAICKDYFKDSNVNHFRDSLKQDTVVDVLGTGTVAFDNSILKLSFHDFSNPGMADIDFAVNSRVDSFPLVAISRDKNWLTPVESSSENSSPNLFDEFFSEGELHADLLNANASQGLQIMASTLKRNLGQVPLSAFSLINSVLPKNFSRHVDSCMCLKRSGSFFSRNRVDLALQHTSLDVAERIVARELDLNDLRKLSISLEAAQLIKCAYLLSSNEYDNKDFKAEVSKSGKCSYCRMQAIQSIMLGASEINSPKERLSLLLEETPKLDFLYHSSKLYRKITLFVTYITLGVINRIYDFGLFRHFKVLKKLIQILTRYLESRKRKVRKLFEPQKTIINYARELSVNDTHPSVIWDLLVKSKRIDLDHLISFVASFSGSNKFVQKAYIDILSSLPATNKPLAYQLRENLHVALTGLVEHREELSESARNEASFLLLNHANRKLKSKRAAFDGIFMTWAAKRLSLVEFSTPKFFPDVKFISEMISTPGGFMDELNGLWKYLGIGQVDSADISISSWGTHFSPAEPTERSYSYKPIKNSPRIAVCMATYNSEATVGAAINSIQNQTHEDLEIWCVDDMSTDLTVDIIADIAKRDSRVKLVALKNKLGPYSIRNYVLTNTHADFFAIADSDDWSHPERLARQIEMLVTNDALICTTNHFRITATVFQLETTGEYLGEGPSSSLYRKSAFQRFGPFLDTKTRGDIEFLKRATSLLGESARTKVDLPLVLALYSQTSNSRPFTAKDLSQFRQGWKEFHSKLAAELDDSNMMLNLITDPAGKKLWSRLAESSVPESLSSGILSWDNLA